MVAAEKKTYSKPELIYESLVLSQNISSSCEVLALFGEGTCPVKLVGVDGFNLMIFQGTGQGCEFAPPNTDDYICYHAPSEMNNVFSS